MKPILRILLSALISLILLVVAAAATLVYPQPFFSEKLELDGLTLYADIPIDETLAAEAVRMSRTSEEKETSWTSPS